ncbi:MAG: UDP-2,3-diacylglucosamine diphosphatase [Gammaproteobacteria bacterium]|nr:UDP-2,3-diacylglucosamine diphosphatase [Gammaproteobacteria bacterium]
MTILFISDLHLEESRPDIANIFLTFLAHEAKQANALYILGDFFETWIGDDDLSPFNLSIINALKNAVTGGLPIYIMQGNRDFLLNKKFMHLSGCTLLPDEHVIDLYGTPTLLMHGDTLCTADIAYLNARKKYKMWIVQKLILLKSLEKRRAMAARMRAASKARTKTVDTAIMDVTQAEVERVMKKHSVQHLIHGHTHRLAVHEFLLEGKPATRTVLGPWHEHGSVLVCDDKGQQNFMIL